MKPLLLGLTAALALCACGAGDGDDPHDGVGDYDPRRAGAGGGEKIDDTPQESPLRGLVVINEVAARGEPADWFELANLGDEDIALGDWAFTDDPLGEPQRGAFPEGAVVPAGGFLVVEVSDDTCGFKLGSDEELAVFDPEGLLVDQADWEDGDSPEGGSFARTPDGTGQFTAALTATPAAAND